MQSADASGGLPNTFLRNLSQHHQGVDVFAYYKVIRELGTGAFGVVNLVQNIATGDQYAMKEITIGPNAKLSVLRNEINLWRGLQHPNIVRLVETYESATHIHMIMELCTGGHMLNAVKTRKQAFPEDQAKEIVRKLSSSIYYLHLKNICHRDIKLENILYETDQDGSDVKLCEYQVSFEDEVWKDVSLEAKSLIKKLLNVLRHPWIASAKTNNLPTQEYICRVFCVGVLVLTSFDQLNVLHNGVLTLLDLEQASLTDQYPTVDFQKIFQRSGNSNQVNFLEFVSATMTVNLQSEKVLRKAYGLFSPDETKGGITEASLGRTSLACCVGVLGCDFDEASVKEMIRTADVNKDGAVNYNEFVNLLEVRLARSWYRA
ncbi:hypothetical protein DYB32_001052 [Aphanomyces invadans]|uniref:Uncharacterized protein n=1 Tax=Aphanomyces invadans TaxID=157072 RepID=A0A418B7V6_9STRA|nr:hypothetical protein DYB32_001052 [Aphanomyces invadans]